MGVQVILVSDHLLSYYHAKHSCPGDKSVHTIDTNHAALMGPCSEGLRPCRSRLLCCWVARTRAGICIVSKQGGEE